jgi:nucleoside-diphosphate-sugar epimerase
MKQNAGVGATALVTGASALISGATGFLGSHLVHCLQQAGFRVRVLARPGRDVAPLAACGVEIVNGDLTDSDSLQRAAAGQRFVFHTAGKVTDWGRREDFFKANSDGTARLLAACQEAGVERFVHVSSLTVLGLPRTGTTVNEETPCASAARDPYTASKIAAEMRAREAHGRRGLAVTIVRPGVIWGPGDVTFVPRLARLLCRGRMVYIGRAENILGLSHVDNLCAGIILAATVPGATGQTYHLTDGEEITARTAISAIAAALGVQPPRVSIPFWALYTAAAILEGAARLAGSTAPLLTRYSIRLLACDNRYDISKARRELGYKPKMTFQSGVAGLGLAGAVE